MLLPWPQVDPALPYPISNLPHALGLAAILVLPTVKAAAQDLGQCRENRLSGAPVNPAKSALWHQQFAARDQALMNRIAGQWVSELISDIDGNRMINRQIQSLDGSGAYGCRDETCALTYPQMPCSTDQGYGRWAALPQQGGSFQLARTVSDLNRQEECIGATMQLQGPDVMLDSQTGQVLAQRMQ